MVVRVLHLAKCKSAQATISLVEKVANELGLRIEIEDIVISTLEDAIRFQHIGSPTIQIDGIDIDPSARTITQFGMT